MDWFLYSRGLCHGRLKDVDATFLPKVKKDITRQTDIMHKKNLLKGTGTFLLKIT